MRETRARWGVVAVAAALCALATMPAAAFGFPKLRSNLIVPNRSLGPLKLNVTYSAAVRALGTSRGGNCRAAYGCSWGNTPSSKTGAFSFSMAQTTRSPTIPIVVSIGIGAPSKSVRGKLVTLFTGPLMKLKTSKKIGLGSTARAVRRAYPRATPLRSGRRIVSYTIYGSGSVRTRPQTTFLLGGGRVVGIQVQALPLG